MDYVNRSFYWDIVRTIQKGRCDSSVCRLSFEPMSHCKTSKNYHMAHGVYDR